MDALAACLCLWIHHIGLPLGTTFSTTTTTTHTGSGDHAVLSMPAWQGVHAAAVEAPPDEYDPGGHGVALPTPTTPWLVVEPARQYHPGAQLPPAVVPILLVEPAPHQKPGEHSPEHVGMV